MAETSRDYRSGWGDCLTVIRTMVDMREVQDRRRARGSDMNLDAEQLAELDAHNKLRWDAIRTILDACPVPQHTR